MSGIAAALAGAMLAAGPGLASAHSLSNDLGGFYGGMLHPVSVPAHLLGLLALALLCGQAGSQKGGQEESGGAALALPWIAAGGVAGLALARPDAGVAIQMLLLGATATAGILVAAATRAPRPVATLLTAAIAFAIMLDSAPGVATAGNRLAALAGTLIAICAGLVWASALLACLQRPWQRIGIRVAGSWTSACAVLVLALVASGRLAAGGAT